MRRIAQALLTLALAAPLFAPILSIGCSKPSAPDPTPAAEEDDDKDKDKAKKKKKKKPEDDDQANGNGGGDDAATAPTTTTTTTGAWKPGMPTATAPTGTTTASTATDPGKTKLMACCTALRNAYAAANAAKTASSGIPLPANAPKVDPNELDKAVKTCDAQVAAWNGDLNTSLSKVKNASTVALPSACSI